MSKVKKFFWKVWLRLNLLTKNVDNDYVAEVSTVGHTLHNAGIAERIVKRRSEHHIDTIMAILDERDEIVRDAFLEGTPVQDRNIRLQPRVTGNWIGTSFEFDPAKHKITCDATLTAEMRAALEEVGVEVLGVKSEGGAHIGLVTDVTTGKTDGTITSGKNLIIDGDKIRIAPEDETGLGVFFVAADGSEIPVTDRFTKNDPKQLIITAPALPAGTYTLKIVTRFTSGNNFLKQPRTIPYVTPLHVG